MGVFEQFPYANMHEMNLEWLLKKMKELDETVRTFLHAESVKFADPIQWNITTQYEKNTIVLNESGDAFLSKQPVPTGIGLDDTEYWLEIFNFMDYIKSFNSNLSFNIETNTARATHAYSEDDWLVWENLLYIVTANIAIDDILSTDTNLERYTVEAFCRAWKEFILQQTQEMYDMIQQYKDDIDASEAQYKEDIDASEAAYRQQLANDMASVTASLQAQLNAAISGATVDSEVINARVGYDNTIYDTLGIAIRDQIGDLHTFLNKHFVWSEHNYFDNTFMFNDTSINSNGEEASAPGTQSTDFLPHFEGGENYIVSVNGSAYYPLVVAFYDSSKTFISRIVSPSTGFFTTPADTAYIRISSNNVQPFPDKTQVESGLTITAWMPYYTFADAGISDIEKAIFDNIYNKAILGKVYINNNAVAPYDDLDTLPAGSVVLYASTTGILHTPTSDGGTLISYSYLNSDVTGCVQLYVTYNDVMYMRIRWGLSWTAWKSIVGTDVINNKAILGKVYINNNAVAPYDDLDTVPAGSVVLYASTTGILHTPTTKGGTAISYSYANSDLTGCVQIYITYDNEVHRRIRWGNGWTSWKLLANEDEAITGTLIIVTDSKSAPYDDLNTLPINSTVIYGNVNNTSNTPKGFTFGSVLTYGAAGNNAGAVQIAIQSQLSSNTTYMFYRTFWAGAWCRWRRVDNSADPHPSLSLFESIGVIGDSFASGNVVVNGTGADLYEISWPQILGRMTGIDVTNYSKAGLTTATWLSDATYGLAKFLSDNKKNMYILALGLNDVLNGESYIGSESDLHTDYTTNPDSFYGNYGRIIGNIMDNAPDAMIIMSTMAKQNDSYPPDSFNTAIKTIAAHYSIPVIDQNDDAFFQEYFYRTNFENYHPTVLNYAAMAEHLKALIEMTMVEYSTYFNNYRP